MYLLVYPPIASVLGLGQVSARSKDLHLDIPCGWQGPKQSLIGSKSRTQIFFGEGLDRVSIMPIDLKLVIT